MVNWHPLGTIWHPLESPGMRIDENCCSHSLIILYYTWQLCVTIPVWINQGCCQVSPSWGEPTTKWQVKSTWNIAGNWFQILLWPWGFGYYCFLLFCHIPLVVKILFIGFFRERLNHQPPNQQHKPRPLWASVQVPLWCVPRMHAYACVQFVC